MALPKVFDYDAGSDETIVTAGVEGFKVGWIGFDLTKKIVHIVVDEGTLATNGENIETVTKPSQQLTLEGDAAIAFYVANKAAMDAIVSGAMVKWAADNDKAGSVVS